MSSLATETPAAIGDQTVLSAEELRTIDAYWRACNYLSLGMLYLWDNPLLRDPLKVEHVKKRLWPLDTFRRVYQIAQNLSHEDGRLM